MEQKHRLLLANSTNKSMNISAKFWDLLASRYDNQGEGYHQVRAKVIENATKYLKASDRVLDYGCATGTSTIEIAGRVKEVHGIDISPKMIKAAKRKMVEQKSQNVDFSQATIFDQRFEPESFDVILAFGILHLLRNPAKAIKRIRELLKPGGWFVSSTACVGDDKMMPTLINAVLFVPIRLGIFPYLSFSRIPKLVRSISHGGFQIVETKTRSFDPAAEQNFVVAHFIAAKKDGR